MSNKSEATWHPNTPPAAGNADLIQRLRQYAAIAAIYGPDGELVFEAANAIESMDRADETSKLGKKVK